MRVLTVAPLVLGAPPLKGKEKANYARNKENSSDGIELFGTLPKSNRFLALTRW